MMLLLSRCKCGFFLLLFYTVALAQVDIPQLSRRVTDLTATLSPEQTSALENRLASFEAKKGSQIAVLIVPTTQPEDIAQFGIRVADAWKVGRKNVDDGVILIVAKDDRKFRLEVGYGLEGVIPDAVAKRVTSEIIKPYFKTGDYAGGIDAGVSQLIKLIEGEPLPSPDQGQGGQFNDAAILLILLLSSIAGLGLSEMFGRTTGGILAGLGSGVAAMLFFGLGFVASLVIAIIVFFITYVRNSGGSGWSSGGGFGSGNGGSWSGGGDGGSSWGGGGGGFGGGGASDSW